MAALKARAKGVKFARDMGTEPGKSIYPESFAKGVRDLFKGVSGVRVEVMGLPEMKRRNMGALMGVGQGSVHDPRLIVVTYMGGERGADPIALVGKVADIKSTAGSPGASIGGAVIGTFVDKDRPWGHLDIAGVDWLDSSIPTTPKGHAGWGVRFMDGVVRDLEE